MDTTIISVIAALVVSMVITGVLIPKILLISFRKNLFDEPDKRKIHKMMVPRLGGIAFMPSIFFTVAVLIGLNRIMFTNHIAPSFVFDSVAICFGMCAVMIVYLVGIADDLIGVKYRAKFVAQLIAAAFLVADGQWIHNLDGFIGIYDMPPVAGVTLSILVVIFIMNAINLIDGIDGLASGLSAIALAIFAGVFFTGGHLLYAIACCAALGTLIPFFYYNVFGDSKVNKKIFMGDTGALTIGFVLSFMALHLCNVGMPDSFEADTFVIAFSPLIIPCFDVIRVFANRISDGKNPFSPDQTHIHHKLLHCGVPQRWAMIMILISSAILTTFNIILARYINITYLVGADLGIVLGANAMLNSIVKARSNAEAGVKVERRAKSSNPMTT